MDTDLYLRKGIVNFSEHLYNNMLRGRDQKALDKFYANFYPIEIEKVERLYLGIGIFSFVMKGYSYGFDKLTDREINEGLIPEYEVEFKENTNEVDITFDRIIKMI